MKRTWYEHLWQRMTLWAITVEGEMVWWCGDDNHQRIRKLDFEIRWPKRIFTPICWFGRRGHEDYYGECVILLEAHVRPEAEAQCLGWIHAETSPGPVWTLERKETP